MELELWKAFVLNPSLVRMEMILAKYGRDRLLREFEKDLLKSCYPGAACLLKLLRNESPPFFEIQDDFC